jgi:hypothetical protein
VSFTTTNHPTTVHHDGFHALRLARPPKQSPNGSSACRPALPAIDTTSSVAYSLPDSGAAVVLFPSSRHPPPCALESLAMRVIAKSNRRGS